MCVSLRREVIDTDFQSEGIGKLKLFLPFLEKERLINNNVLSVACRIEILAIVNEMQASISFRAYVLTLKRRQLKKFNRVGQKQNWVPHA